MTGTASGRGLYRRAREAARRQARALPPPARQQLRHAVDAANAHRHRRLVLGSGLFDARWYAAQTGCDPDPGRAVLHYLGAGARATASPHPLFHQTYFMARHRKRVAARNPLVAYLTDRRLRAVDPHPLFDAAGYVAAHPEAAPGPLAHYLQRGAAAGYRPNDWYEPDPDAEPRGLVDWVWSRQQEWAQRRSATVSQWRAEPPAAPQSDLPAVAGLVSVVLPAGPAPELLPDAVAAVLAQQGVELELLVVAAERHRAAVTAQLAGPPADPRLRLVPLDSGGRAAAGDAAAGGDEAAALAAGVAAATGEWVAFCLPTAPWLPRHLAQTVATARRHRCGAAYDVVERVTADGARQFATVATSPERAAVAPQAFLGALVVRRELLAELGGVDAGLHRAAGYDLELRLLAHGPLPLAPHVGVSRPAERDRRAAEAVAPRDRPRLELATLDSWAQVAVDRSRVRWAEVDRAGVPGLASVIIPTHVDSAMTSRAVRCVSAAQQAALAADPDAARIEVIVVDNGCPVEDAIVLDSLPLRYPDTRIVHEPVNRGFALANNLAVPHSRGSVLVFLNNDTEAQGGWLAPLVEALEDPTVHGAQSLLTFPSGSIQSAGVAFASTGGVPHVLLQGFPVEDAAGLADAELHALTGAALAMRRPDVVALRGFDPIFRNGMEDIDLGLRMAALRPGRFTVRPQSRVVHHEARTPGRYAAALVNRRILLDRYAAGLPSDEAALWGAAGYDVVGHEIRLRLPEERRLEVLEPVLVRRPLAEVREGVPRLRWALKSPAPAGPNVQRWGDTHFARGLAQALERLGQQVVVDHRGEFERASGVHDDVVLVLRGTAPYAPVYGQLSVEWIISHPELVSRAELADFDLVFAASEVWSRRMTDAWGVRIEPLLQATDPQLFHPDRGAPDTGHQVLFVGTSRKVERPLIRDAVAAGLPLSIYGHDWERYVPAAYVKADFLSNDEVGVAYRRAGIVLNDHWADMRADGFISNRLFDAAASGARVVTDDVAGLDGLFGRSVQVVRSADELAEIAGSGDLDGVFGDDAERRAVAARVHAEHSFDARAATVLDAVLRRRGERG